MLRVTELGFCYCVGNTYMHSLDGLKCNSNSYLVSRILCMNLKMTTKLVYPLLKFTTIDPPAVKESWFVSADSTRGKCHCIPHRNYPERLIL